MSKMNNNQQDNLGVIQEEQNDKDKFEIPMSVFSGSCMMYDEQKSEARSGVIVVPLESDGTSEFRAKASVTQIDDYSAD